MKKAVKIIIIIAVILVVLIGAYMIGSGFKRASNIYVIDYKVSGETMTIRVVSGNTVGGFVRTLKPVKNGSDVTLNPYSAFGGINGKIGAKDDFDIDVSGADKIYMSDASGKNSKLVLEKVDGEWIKR